MTVWEQYKLRIRFADFTAADLIGLANRLRSYRAQSMPLAAEVFARDFVLPEVVVLLRELGWTVEPPVEVGT